MQCVLCGKFPKHFSKKSRDKFVFPVNLTFRHTDPHVYIMTMAFVMLSSSIQTVIGSTSAHAKSMQVVRSPYRPQPLRVSARISPWLF